MTIPGSQPDRVGLYDAYLATLGGGENFLAVFAELLEQEFPHAEIEIITHEGNHVPLETLAQRFGVVLERTRLRRLRPDSRSHMPVRPLRRFLHERDVSELSAEYDLFLNNTIYSLAPPRSRCSVYMCMFPLTPVPWSWRERRLRRWLLSPYVDLRRRLYRRWIGTYDLILANSRFTQGWIRRMWGLESEVLYPPIETRSELRLDKKRKRILSIGRFFPGDHNKKHDVLIRAFRCLRREEELAGWELHLVGGRTRVAGTDAYLDRLVRLAGDEPVFFHLDASRSQLEELLETSCLFWHATGFEEDQERVPEKLEHFGMSTVEAMTWGCVPLAFHCGGQPEIIAQGENGFLWRNEAELHDQTLRLVREPVLREAMARAAHTHSQHFSRAAFRARSLHCLDRLLRDLDDDAGAACAASSS